MLRERILETVSPVISLVPKISGVPPHSSSSLAICRFFHGPNLYFNQVKTNAGRGVQIFLATTEGLKAGTIGRYLVKFRQVFQPCSSKAEMYLEGPATCKVSPFEVTSDSSRNSERH